MNYTQEEGNLLEAEEDYVIGHCIDSHAVMGAGVARQLIIKYPELCAIRRNINPLGSCVLFETDEGRFIANLITKPHVGLTARAGSDYPNYETMRAALNSLKFQMQYHGLQKLAIPQIGCGIDGLDWNVVRDVLEDVFFDSDIEVKVLIFNPTKKKEAV